MAQPTRRAKTSAGLGALQLELKLLLPDGLVRDRSGYAPVGEHPGDGAIQIERVSPGGSVADHLNQLRPNRNLARRNGVGNPAPDPVDESHPLTYRVGPHRELNLLPVGHGHGSNNFPVARKGVREKKGQGLSISGGCYT